MGFSVSGITVISHIDPTPADRTPVVVFKATVEVLVEVPTDVLLEGRSDAYALDAISEPFRDLFVDWQYVHMPRPVTINNPHHEGDIP